MKEEAIKSLTIGELEELGIKLEFEVKDLTELNKLIHSKEIQQLKEANSLVADRLEWS